MPDDHRVFSARADGNKLYVKTDPTGPEAAYDWTGPPGAHHATIEMSSSTHVYTTRWEWKVSVYDAAGTLLGEITEERWD